MKNIRLENGTSLQVEFKPGQWAAFTTTWTQPDADGNNKALRGAQDRVQRA